MNETFGATFLAPFKKLPYLFSHCKPPEETQRTLLHDFSGSVQAGEMLLVLGKPGSGCSTFLKTIASQIDGYESVDGEVTYGGLSAKEIKENYRGEVVYNQGIFSLVPINSHRGRHSLCYIDGEANVGICIKHKNTSSPTRRNVPKRI